MKSNTLFASLLALVIAPSVFGQGALLPANAPAQSMKTLSQIEPRTPISSLPFTISQSGAYYLTTNLLVTNNGLTVAASDVEVDLGGFAITGQAGAGAAIFGNGTLTNITVRNGSIHSMPSSAISASLVKGFHVSSVRAWANTGGGVNLGSDAVVEDCYFAENGTGSVGISVDLGSRVERCEVRRGFYGIQTGPSCIVKDCIVSSNGNFGLFVSSNCNISGCITYSNGTSGLNAGAHCLVESCTSSRNASDGISVGAVSQVARCVVRSNNASGISLGSYAIVRDCVSSDNANYGFSSLSNPGCKVTDCTAENNGLAGITLYSGGVAARNYCHGSGGATIGLIVYNFGNRIEDNQFFGMGYGIRVDGPNNFIFRNTSISGTNYVFNSSFSSQLAGPIVTNSAALATNSAWANLGQ